MRKHGLAFVLLGCACAHYAWNAPLLPLRAALASAALCFFLVGAGLLLERHGVFLKRPQGSLAPASFLLFWPYHLLNALSLLAVRLFSRERSVDEIAPNLYLGRRLTQLDREFRHPCMFQAVLDLTSEFPECRELAAEAEYLCIPLLDTAAPAPDQLAEGIDFIREHRGRGPVLVHCALGHGRSATFVAGYLLAEGMAADVEEALEMVRDRRPGIGLSAPQRVVLESLRDRIGYDALTGRKREQPDEDPA